jgi:hypothetical protein
MTAQAQFSFEQLKSALESSNAANLLSLYADDCSMTIVDRNKPPSSPMKLSGKDAITAFWKDVCARDMTHAVGREVVGADRVSFIEECTYPDGCRVMSSTMLETRDGRIVNQLTVQAWDDVESS